MRSEFHAPHQEWGIANALHGGKDEWVSHTYETRAIAEAVLDNQVANEDADRITRRVVVRTISPWQTPNELDNAIYRDTAGGTDA